MRKVLAGAVIVMVSLFVMSVSTVFAQDYCNGNFDCDGDVDGTDAAVFKADFGRGGYTNPCPGCPPPAPVPKTGQTTVYGSRDDAYWQQALGVETPNPRFTDNLDGTVRDNLTGLIWLKNANCFESRTWDEALSACNDLAHGSCGLTDGSLAGIWRLPNRLELLRLLNLEYFDPALSNTEGTGQWSEGDIFNNVDNIAIYWSSTTFYFQLVSDDAWTVNVRLGNVPVHSKSDDYYVWCVRGGDY